MSRANNCIGIGIGIDVMSIREPEAVTGPFDRVWDEFGGLDLLVNNGGGQFPQDAIDNSIKGWNAVIDTNLNGTWYMMQTAARRWRDANQPGNIINIVLNIDRGTRQTTHTCAARAGVFCYRSWWGCGELSALAALFKGNKRLSSAILNKCIFGMSFIARHKDTSESQQKCPELAPGNQTQRLRR